MGQSFLLILLVANPLLFQGVFGSRRAAAVPSKGSQAATSQTTIVFATSEATLCNGGVMLNLQVPSNGHGAMPVRWTPHSSYASCSDPQMTGFAQRAPQAAGCPKRTHESLGSCRPEAMNHAPLHFTSFKVLQTSILPLGLGFLVALGCCSLFKRRISPVHERGLDVMKCLHKDKDFHSHWVHCKLLFRETGSLIPKPTLLTLFAILPSIVASQSPPITLGLISHWSSDSLAGVVCASRSAVTFNTVPLPLAALQRNEVQVAISSFYSFGNARAMEWISACTAHASASAIAVGREVLSVAVRAESCLSCMPLHIVMASGPAASSGASTSFPSGGSVTLQLPTEVGKKALEAADRPERSRQRLGTGRPEVTGRAPLRCHLGQASDCLDGRPFKMRAAMIVSAVFGFLVALAYCPLFKTRNSGVPHRGCDMMKCLRQRKSVVVRSLLLMLIAILPPVVVSQTPPITEGLIAHYNADSWTGTRAVGVVLKGLKLFK